MPPAFYPRLHRLSVLNIIYHGNFDYPLNPWCTSFAGNSGVGKSLIADLLQLIFVGKGEYKSATRGQESRPPEGLVLDDVATGGKGLGYAFLSVEKEPGHFLVVGCYLAAATRAVVPFIVQQGISFAGPLLPLRRPIGYRDLLTDDGRVLPPLDLAALVRQREQASIKFFEHRVSEFHRLLYDNYLLPLDVNQPGVLKSYASIIQSFSRGMDLDYHQKPDKLKKFLFGEEAQQDILREYERRTEAIREQLADYQENGRQATLLQDKLLRFNGLHQKHQALRQAHLTLLQSQLAYWQGEALQAETRLKLLSSGLQRGETARRQLRQAKCQLDAARTAQTQQQHAELQTKRQTLTDEAARQRETEQAAQHQAQALRPAAEQARRYEEATGRVTSWLATHGTVADLRQAQRQHQQQRREQELLWQLEAHLRDTGQHAFFSQSVWARVAPSAAEAALHALREEVAASQREQLFADLDSPDSLAGWALRRGQSLTLAEESILAHFGRQATWREQEAGYYLHTPDELLASPLETEAGEHNPGFWLHLRGVRLWVPHLAEADRAFTDADETRIRQLFAARRQAASRDLGAQAARLAQEEALATTWPQFPEWQAALAAWPRRQAIRQAAPAELLPVADAFEELLALYETDATGRAAYVLAGQQAADAEAALKAAQDALAVNLFQQRQVADEVAKLPPVDAEAVARAEAAARQAAQELADWQQENQLAADALPYQETELAGLLRDGYQLGKAEADQENDLKKLRVQLEETQELAAKCHAEYERYHTDYRELTDEPALTASPAGLLPAALPDPAPAAAAQRAYEADFDQLRAGLSAGVAERLDYDGGPVPLMQELLPEVLHGVVESVEALRLVEEKLQRINENNRLIAKLKIELLQEVFNRVHQHYYAYVEEAKRIRKYFLERKVQITGGFKPELKFGAVPDYPLEWMTIFGQLLREQASQPAQFAHLGEAESLEELMYQAYRLQGGPLPQPRWLDLLNPRSYLHVEFGMGSARVKVNKGSTGQSFMAVALLNIARLSISGGGEQRPGIRFMPVDEAAGLGTNYDVLLALARDKSYQVISLSPDPVLDEASEQHRVYFLAFDPDAPVSLNLHPMMLTMAQKLVPVPAPLPFANSLFTDAPDQPAAAE
jgi:hypothetical protein